MSRSGYTDDGNLENYNLYRANVDRAFAGKRGQAFLKEVLAALDALPEKRLIENMLHEHGEVCAIGSVGKARGLHMPNLEDYEDWDIGIVVAKIFGIAAPMAREIMYMNDSDYGRDDETPEQRYTRMRKWIAEEIK